MTNFEPYDFKGDLNSHSFKLFLKLCADKGVSDILIQGGDYIWVEIHGRQYKGSLQTVKQGQMSALVASVWSSDIENNIRAGKGADRALEIFGEELDIQRGKYIRFRCNFIQGRVARIDEAYCITMRIIPSDLPDISKMGIESDLFENLYPEMGLILICGPTGSGKSTLLAGIYAHAGKEMPDRKVVTYEDPIEFVLGGTHWLGPQPAQSQIGRDISSFAMGLKNAMRRKPSIIGIGEARDLETVDAMVEAALSGHLTMATLHTESVADTINRIIQVYPPAQQSAVAARLIGTIRVIAVQRLLKTTDGKRIAVREYVVFDREFRNKLQSESFEKWSLMLRMHLEEAELTLVDKAWKLFLTKKIDENEFITIAGVVEFNKRNSIIENNLLIERDN